MRNRLSSGRPSAAIVLGAFVVLAALAAAMSDPEPARAQGVHFDPDSPAGKEYAIPLEQARNEAAGTTPEGSGEIGRKEESSTFAPLFGVGIGTGGGAGTAAGAGRGANTEAPGRGGSTAGGAASEGRAPGGSPREAALSANRLADVGDGYPTTSAVALVAFLVLVGLALGLALRGFERMRPSS
jgi:hypothetical protein